MELNKLFIRDKGKALTPVYVSGESYSFFLNSDSPFTDPNWATLDLHILTPNGQVAAIAFAQLIRALPWSTSPAYFLYCSFAMPQLPNGQYQFAVMQYSEDAYKLKSNIILVENDITDRTAFVEYRNTFNKYGILYETEQTFKNRFRLPIAQVDLQYQSDRKQYRNVTDGRLRNVTSYRDAVLKLQAIRFDDPGFEAFSAMLEHDDINIEGYQLEPKGGVSIESNPIATLRNGTVETFVSNPDNQYNFYNGYGDTFIYAGTADYEPAIIYEP